VLFRGNSLALTGVLGFMVALCVGGRRRALDRLGPVNGFIGVGRVFGSTAADVMIGVLVGNLFVGKASSASRAARLRFLLVFGAGHHAAGILLRPPRGIHKIAATESCALVTGGLCCPAFGAAYLVVEVLNWRRRTRFAAPVGQSSLPAFLPPRFVLDLSIVPGMGSVLFPRVGGLLGALNAAALTALILLVTWGMTRMGVRIEL
jgi:hypothetical protein